MHALLRLVLASAFALAAPSALHAQSFPDGPVALVVPYPAGGSVDFTARLFAPYLAKEWKQPVIVENRAGAAAVIGSQFVARAKPDGRTVLVATAGMSIQPSVHKDLPYDFLKDFVPVTQLVTSPSLLSVHPSIPASTLPELVRYLKNHPGTPFSSQGLGSHAHLLMELLRSEAGLDLLHVPYRGSAPATTALLAGETKLQFDIMTSALPHIAAGKLKPIAVTTPERRKQLPNVQTMLEAGFPTLTVSSWTGLMVPAGTPAAAVRELHRGFRAALSDAGIGARLVDSGYVIVGSSPEEFAAFFRQDIERFAKAAALAKVDKTTPN